MWCCASIAEIPLLWGGGVSHLSFACSPGGTLRKGGGVSHPFGHVETPKKTPIARNRGGTAEIVSRSSHHLPPFHASLPSPPIRNAIRANRFVRSIRNWSPYFYNASCRLARNHSNFWVIRANRVNPFARITPLRMGQGTAKICKTQRKSAKNCSVCSF